MSDNIDDIKKIWQDSRLEQTGDFIDVENTILLAKQQMRRAVRLQLGGIVILIIVVAGLCAYFFYVARFRQTISHIGSGLMIGGLIIRIITEIFSIYFSTTINMADSALKANDDALRYFAFRRKVNGPLTTFILIIYTLGFYMLTPEFSLYFSTAILILIDVSYLVAAFIFTYFIRSSIKQETVISRQVLEITKELGRKE